MGVDYSMFVAVTGCVWRLHDVRRLQVMCGWIKDRCGGYGMMLGFYVFLRIVCLFLFLFASFMPSS